MRNGNCFNSLKHNTGRYNVSVSTISKDLTPTEIMRKNEGPEPVWKCRYVMVMFSFLAFFFLSSYRMNMSIGIVAMVTNSAISHQMQAKSYSCPLLMTNTTENETEQAGKKIGEFAWSPRTQGYILSSYFFGYLFTQIPTGRLAERFGFKWFLFSSSVITAVCTLLVPLSAWLGASALIVVQTLRGLAQGMIQPTLSVLTINWFPKIERGPLYAITKSGCSLGNFLTSIISGFLCESPGGWPSSFYVLGAAGVILSISIVYFVFENPKVHPRISSSEVNFIISNQEGDFSRKRPEPPWRMILTSIPVYALAFSFFGQQWAITHFLVVHSTFLSTILHYPVGQNGLLSAAPFLLQFFLSEIAAWLSYYIHKKDIAGVDFLRKFWTIISSLGYSVCLIGIYIAGCNRTLSVVFSILATGCTGFAFAGCWITSVDMAPTFAASVHAFTSTLGYICSVIVPLAVGYLTDESQTIEQWNKFFFLCIGVVMASGLTFCIFGSAVVQPWDCMKGHDPEEDKTQLENHKERSEKYGTL